MSTDLTPGRDVDEWPGGGGVSEIYETRWDAGLFPNSTQAGTNSAVGSSPTNVTNNSQTPQSVQPDPNNQYMGLPPNGSTVISETPDSRARLLRNIDGSFSVETIDGGLAKQIETINAVGGLWKFDASTGVLSTGTTITVYGSRPGGTGDTGGAAPLSKMLTHADYSSIPENGYEYNKDAARAGIALADSLNNPPTDEYGGGTVRVGDRYWFTQPVTRGEGYHFGAAISIPDGGVLAGIYHLHPAGINSTFFSIDDVNMAASMKVPSYIGTYADSSIHYYDPATMHPTTITDAGMPFPGSKGGLLCSGCFHHQ